MVESNIKNDTLISFIIPLYSVKKRDFIRCMDSIYSQNIDNSTFEVICVDDCSPTSETEEIVTKYKYNAITPPNLTFVKHTVNKRQGGARNTAIENAKGRYVFFIDQDDFICKGCIDVMIRAIRQYDGIDLVMFDFVTADEYGNITQEGYYKYKYDNNFELISGREFLSSYETPWGPWLYLYRTAFLQDNHFRFEENVRFEDIDFVMRCTANAKGIIFIPSPAITHTESEYQTSAIGDSSEKIIDFLKLIYRTGLVAQEEFDKGHCDSGKAILQHHLFGYRSQLKTYLWRLRYKNLYDCLTKYPPLLCTDDIVLSFIAKHPQLSTVLLKSATPVLRSAYYFYRLAKRQKKV